MPKGIYLRTKPNARKGIRETEWRTFTCTNCQRSFEGPPSANRRFCSDTCFKAWNQGTNHPAYKEQLCGTRYRMVKHKGRVLPQHRVIAEQVLGRPLKRNEVVHHINGDKTDNRNCNLLICTVGYHAWLHTQMALKYQQTYFAPKPTSNKQ